MSTWRRCVIRDPNTGKVILDPTDPAMWEAGVYNKRKCPVDVWIAYQADELVPADSSNCNANLLETITAADDANAICKVFRFSPSAKLPIRATDGAAG